MSETSDLITFLNAHQDRGWSGWPPATEAEIREAEEQLGIQLSQEYRQFLLHHEGGEVKAESGYYFRLYCLEEICEFSSDLQGWNEYLPGALFFATDDGDSIVYFDTENRVGRGAWAIYVCGMGASFFDVSIYVGKTMQEFFERVLRGEDIFAGSFLRDEGLEFDDAGNRIK
jgi:SMI1 / KNR4 family (SUKH-1)